MKEVICEIIPGLTLNGEILSEFYHPVDNLVRCKDCKHRPEEPEDGADNGFDYIFPDNVCPCKCDGDEWYSWRPSDNWFCPKGERKDGDGE